MATAMKTAGTIDAYIAGFPEEVRIMLEKIRVAISKAAPEAKESINYGIPTFTLEGNLVHFGGFKNHIGFYPAPSGIDAFKKELSVYEGAKGSIKFPLDKPLPLPLVTKIVKFRVKENLEKEKGKKTNPQGPLGKATAKPLKKKLPDEEQVNEWLSKLNGESKTEINAVRKIIKSANPKLNERIKWNAPSYYYKDDILTFGPYKTHKLLLVFHHPAVVKVKSELLQEEYKDRRLVYFKDKAEAEKNKKEIARIINEIVKMIDKK